MTSKKTEEETNKSIYVYINEKQRTRLHISPPTKPIINICIFGIIQVKLKIHKKLQPQQQQRQRNDNNNTNQNNQMKKKKNTMKAREREQICSSVCACAMRCVLRLLISF